MPRVSIIIPHRHDDNRLEATVLSVLENRPEDCEVIVVHDGSYSDPYSLDDEVVFVHADRGSDAIQLMNAGAMAACSPVIHTLLDGVSVHPDWTASAIELISQNSNVAAVAIPIQRLDGKRTCGTSSRSISPLGGRSIRHDADDDCVGPEVACGFYRRKVLLALRGFNDSLDLSSADIDFALALRELGLTSEVDGSTRVSSSTGPQKPTAKQMRQIARLAVQYRIASGGLGQAAGALVRGFITARPIHALAWITGLLTASSSQQKQAARLSIAKGQLADQPETLKIYTSAPQQKRAA